MLKKLFAASLLLILSATLNATPIKTGINGAFDVLGQGPITTDENGIITSVGFNLLITGATNDDDYRDYWVSSQVITTLQNPLVLSLSLDQLIFSFSGFYFILREIRSNISTLDLPSGLFSSNLVLIGDISHDDFITTSSQFHFSTQALVKDSTNQNKGFSITVTSPAPSPISEPGTLAIFGLVLIGFAASRKKTSA
jgi:hypothetical protein